MYCFAPISNYFIYEIYKCGASLSRNTPKMPKREGGKKKYSFSIKADCLLIKSAYFATAGGKGPIQASNISRTPIVVLI